MYFSSGRILFNLLYEVSIDLVHAVDVPSTLSCVVLTLENVCDFIVDVVIIDWDRDLVFLKLWILDIDCIKLLIVGASFHWEFRNTWWTPCILTMIKSLFRI